MFRHVLRARSQKPARIAPTNLAVALLQGRNLREQAEARGVMISTERTHLKALMRKTNTRSQADLVRLLAGFCSALP